MRTKALLLVGMLFSGTLAASHAGGAYGVRWGGCGGNAVGVRWGGGGSYWGGGWGYCAPRYYAPRAYYGGWGWSAPFVGVRVVTPAPIYTAVFVPGGSYGPSPAFSMVADAQEQLADLGYYGGAIDGAFGPVTSAAVQRYQRDYGLPVTGRLDRNTRASLGL